MDAIIQATRQLRHADALALYQALNPTAAQLMNGTGARLLRAVADHGGTQLLIAFSRRCEEREPDGINNACPMWAARAGKAGHIQMLIDYVTALHREGGHGLGFVFAYAIDHSMPLFDAIWGLDRTESFDNMMYETISHGKLAREIFGRHAPDAARVRITRHSNPHAVIYVATRRELTDAELSGRALSSYITPSECRTIMDQPWFANHHDLHVFDPTRMMTTVSTTTFKFVFVLGEYTRNDLEHMLQHVPSSEQEKADLVRQRLAEIN